MYLWKFISTKFVYKFENDNIYITIVNWSMHIIDIKIINLLLKKIGNGFVREKYIFR